jgi:hypothetical protein
MGHWVTSPEGPACLHFKLKSIANHGGNFTNDEKVLRSGKNQNKAKSPAHYPLRKSCGKSVHRS